MCCIAFRLSYGKFDYYNGGDLTGAEYGSWRDIETPVGMVTGPLEVCEAIIMLILMPWKHHF